MQLSFNFRKKWCRDTVSVSIRFLPSLNGPNPLDSDATAIQPRQDSHTVSIIAVERPVHHQDDRCLSKLGRKGVKDTGLMGESTPSPRESCLNMKLFDLICTTKLFIMGHACACSKTLGRLNCRLGGGDDFIPSSPNHTQ